MPNKNRLLFFVDHKYRDLKSLSLISFFLRKMGYETKLTALWNFNEIKKFNAKYIFFNKPHMFDREKIKNILENRYNLCITTEGQAHNRQPIINFACDLNFFWNRKTFNIYDKIPIEKKKMIGCQRTDYLNKQIIADDKKNLITNFKKILKHKKKNITFAIPDTSSRFQKKKLYSYCENVDKTHFNVETSYLQYVKYHRNAKKLLINYVSFFSKKYKNFNFIIKPHPNDDHKFWIDLSKKRKNIIILFGMDISNFLKLSSLHITVEGCNTTFEALYNKIPTAEICLDKDYSKLELDNITLKLCENKINSTKDFEEILNNTFKRQKFNFNFVLLKKYIKYHFYKIDDQRCKKYAKSIDKFIKKKNKESYIRRLTSLFLIFKHKESISMIYFIFKEILKKWINYNPNIKKFKKKKTKKIDNRGRYDSRISDKDDEIYYEYYKKILN